MAGKQSPKLDKMVDDTRPKLLSPEEEKLVRQNPFVPRYQPASRKF